MQLRVVNDQPWDVPADVLVVPVAGDPTFDGPLGELDRRANGELQTLVTFGELTGKRYSTALAAPGEVRAGRILLVSMGDPGKLDREVIVRIAAAAERRLGGRSVKRLAVWLSPLADQLEGGAAAAAGLVTRGMLEGAYDPRTIYRDDVDARPPVVDELILVAPDADLAALQREAERGEVIAEGSSLARTLSNRASNDVSPEVLAEEARAIAKRHDLWIDVIEPERATKLGMGMFMAVGRGSDNPPRMILLRSGEEGERDALDRHLAIVGKGVCFDSGGISIKPSERMEEMKMDKTGACTVIAAIATVARLAPGTPLLAVAPAVENMPGPAFHPTGRHRDRVERQEGGHHQHRRRRPPDPGRCAHLRRTDRGDPPGRRRHADRGRLPGPRQPGHRCVRVFAAVLRLGRGGFRASWRTTLAAAADRGLRARRWRAGTATCRTPAPLRAASSRVACSSANS